MKYSRTGGTRSGGAPDAPTDGDRELILERLIAACDRLELSLPDETLSAETREIRHLADELNKWASRTHILAGSALRVVEADLPMEALESVLSDTSVLVGAERGFILLFSSIDGEYDRIEAERLGHLRTPAELSVADTLSRQVFETDQAVLNPDLTSDPRFSALVDGDDVPPRSIMIAPLSVEIEGQSERMGVVYVDALSKNRLFTEADLNLLESFASLAALSIRNVRLAASLRLAYKETVYALVKALEAKDAYTRGHSERVAEYSERCAKRYGMGMQRLEVLYSAALLHDIGKIGIREAILNKPGKLTTEEYDHVKTHPEISEAIVIGLTFLRAEYYILMQHHERYDGKGYPRGLKGDEITLEGAIIQVADAWDAMTSRRIYRRNLDLEEALKELRRNGGTQFNPDVVEVFARMIEEEGIIPVEQAQPE